MVMHETSQLRGELGESNGEVRPDDGTTGGPQDVERAENVFGTSGDATEYFTAPEYREGQREAIEEVEDAFERGYATIVLEGPPGAGKSHIARAFAFQAGNTHIITGQKILQDQYREDFGEEMFVMKGRGEYRSLYEVDPQSGDTFDPPLTCANCLCQRGKQYKLESCPYKAAREQALDEPVVVHNFDSFYFQTTYGGAFGGRKLLIVDECHNISEKYLKFMSFTISNYYDKGKRIPKYNTIAEYDDFIREYHADVKRQVSVLNSLKEGGVLDGSQLRDLREKEKLEKSLSRYIFERERGSDVEYVFDYEDNGMFQRVTFRPVFVGQFVRNSFLPFGERRLFMSATILDKEMFCRTIGISPDEAYFVQMDSTFPAENRKIVYKPSGSMSYKNINDTLPQMVDDIGALLERFPNRKGIIQTHTERIAKYIKDNLPDDRLTFNKDFSSPQEMLEEHQEKDGSIIVASGLREGLDLKGDLSKVQVFCKVPYPSMGDKRVKRMMEIDKKWYGYVTALMLIQALGRSVRSKTDKAVTYILDYDFRKFYGMNKRFIPQYIKEAIVWGG